MNSTCVQILESGTRGAGERHLGGAHLRINWNHFKAAMHDCKTLRTARELTCVTPHRATELVARISVLLLRLHTYMYT